MTREGGATVIELLVASAIMLAASAAALTLVADATTQSPRWNEAADLHQRARVAVDAIARHVARAGAGPPFAAVRAAFPTVDPRRRSSFLLSNTAITIRHVPEGAPWTTVSTDVAPGALTIRVDIHPGCAVEVESCGFVGRTNAAIFDGRGDWHLLIVEPSAPGLLAVADRVPGRTATFAAGSALVEVEETSLYFDRDAGTLRQEGPGEGTFPVVDQVRDLWFDYFAERLEPLPLAALTDGPLCGTGALAYDCDLRRIHTVRASLTIAATHPGTRDLRTSVEITSRRAAR